MSVRSGYSRHCSWCNSKVESKSDYMYHRYLCWGLDYGRSDVLRGVAGKISDKSDQYENRSRKTRTVSHRGRISRSCGDYSSPVDRSRRNVRSKSRRLSRRQGRLSRSRSVPPDNKENTLRPRHRSVSTSRMYKGVSNIQERVYRAKSPMRRRAGSFHRSNSAFALDTLCNKSPRMDRKWVVPELTCTYDCECITCHSSCHTGGYLSEFYREQHCRRGCLCLKCHMPSEVEEDCLEREYWDSDVEDFSSSECDVQYQTSLESSTDPVKRRKRRKDKPYCCIPCGINLNSWDGIRRHIMSVDHLRMSKRGMGEMSLEVDIPKFGESGCPEQLSPRSTCSEMIPWDDMDSSASPKDHLMASLSLMRVDSIRDLTPSVDVPGTPRRSSFEDSLSNLRQSAAGSPVEEVASKEGRSPNDKRWKYLNGSPSVSAVEPSYWPLFGGSISPRKRSGRCKMMNNLSKRRGKMFKDTVVEVINFNDGVYKAGLVEMENLPSVYVSLGQRCDMEDTLGRGLREDKSSSRALRGDGNKRLSGEILESFSSDIDSPVKKLIKSSPKSWRGVHSERKNLRNGCLKHSALVNSLNYGNNSVDVSDKTFISPGKPSLAQNRSIATRSIAPRSMETAESQHYTHRSYEAQSLSMDGVIPPTESFSDDTDPGNPHCFTNTDQPFSITSVRSLAPTQNGGEESFSSGYDSLTSVSYPPLNPPYFLPSLLKEALMHKRKSSSVLVRVDYKKKKKQCRKLMEVIKFDHGVYRVQKVDLKDVPPVYVRLGQRCDSKSVEECDQHSGQSPLSTNGEEKGQAAEEDDGRRNYRMLRFTYKKAFKRQAIEPRFQGAASAVDVSEDSSMEGTVRAQKDVMPSMSCGKDVGHSGDESPPPIEPPSPESALDNSQSDSVLVLDPQRCVYKRYPESQAMEPEVQDGAVEIVGSEDLLGEEMEESAGTLTEDLQRTTYSVTSKDSGVIDSPSIAVSFDAVSSDASLKSQNDSVLVIDAKSFLDRLIEKINENALVCTGCMLPFDTNNLLKQLFP